MTTVPSSQRPCQVTGCTRPVLARGLCAAHYRRQRLGQALDPPIHDARPADTLCAVTDCDKPAARRRRGWCMAHYKRWYRWGNPLGGPAATPRPTECAVPECGRPNFRSGLCQVHYKRSRTEKPLGAPIQPYIRGSVLDRLYARGQRTNSGCLIYHGLITTAGYGKLMYRGRPWLVHRLAYTLAYGEIGKGLDVHHRCGHRACFELDHLEAVSKKEHVARHNGHYGTPLSQNAESTSQRCAPAHKPGPSQT